ncbi:hypothetical protein SAMN05444392_102399 [Seinonella peptonophila]|uniref:Uncharacterized protein n=1 Tax=Seinonella peptonophila TaxID=112248 RepID=A0A1M4VK74_9BACL|nr:hypothetical protein [Seinonella peptonophila]SHE69277.1 hypothetical protein SAMN05444392_102399 [Seinonella peptonophila]
MYAALEQVNSLFNSIHQLLTDQPNNPQLRQMVVGLINWLDALKNEMPDELSATSHIAHIADELRVLNRTQQSNQPATEENSRGTVVFPMQPSAGVFKGNDPMGRDYTALLEEADKNDNSRPTSEVELHLGRLHDDREITVTGHTVQRSSVQGISPDPEAEAFIKGVYARREDPSSEHTFYGVPEEKPLWVEETNPYGNVRNLPLPTQEQVDRWKQDVPSVQHPTGAYPLPVQPSERYSAGDEGHHGCPPHAPNPGEYFRGTFPRRIHVQTSAEDTLPDQPKSEDTVPDGPKDRNGHPVPEKGDVCVSPRRDDYPGSD